MIFEDQKIWLFVNIPKDHVGFKEDHRSHHRENQGLRFQADREFFCLDLHLKSHQRTFDGLGDLVS